MLRAETQRKIRETARRLAESLDADIIAYSGDIESPADYVFLAKMEGQCRHRNGLLFLTTHGGDPDAAFRIARGLHRQYPKGCGTISVYVHLFCKSAGTLLALVSDELVMSDKADLGPLDIQLSKPDELFERLSGLTPIQALTTLRQQVWKTFEEYFLKLRRRSGLQIMTKTAADVASRLAVGLFRPIYAQMDPMRLGEIERAMMIAHQYGSRLDRGNLKEGALEKLIAAYPSHGFIIDKEEAKELFERVREPTDEERFLAELLISNWCVEGLSADEASVEVFSYEVTDEEDDHGKGEPGGSGDAQAPSAETESRAEGGATAGNGEPKPNGLDDDKAAKLQFTDETAGGLSVGR